MSQQPTPSKSIFSSITQNFNKIFNLSNISCTNSDAVQKDNKENSVATILKNDPNLCPQHLRDRSHFCKECQNTLCFVCASEHIPTKHEILDYSELGSFMNKSIQHIVHLVDASEESMIETEFPDYRKEIEAGLTQIQEAKEDVMNMIGLYFDNLDFKFRELFKRVPSVYQINHLKSGLSSLKKEALMFEKLAITTKKPDISEIKHFLNSDFEKKVKNFLMEYENVKQVKDSNKRVNLPNIQITKPYIEQIFNDMPNYCSAIPATDSYYDQIKKIRVATPNYFLPEFESYLPYIDDLTEKLHLYNLSKEASESYNLTVSTEIPADHSVIVTPNLEIFICGGILKNGELSSQTFQCSPFQDQAHNEMTESFQTGIALKEKNKMLQKKVAHSLCYVKNKVYCIGGKINNIERTKKCERYDINTNKWVEIAPLNNERTRPAISSFEDRYIFAFFGCENNGDNCKTVESYDINADRWVIVNAMNQWPQFEVGLASATQINANQIIIFGGFYEGAKHNNKRELIFNERGLLFNVNEGNFVNLGAILPMSYCQSYPPVIVNNNIYSLGYVVKSVSPSFNRYMEADLVLKIENGNVQCRDVFYYK